MYDVVIVGYGPTGMMAAILLARAGHKVAVIERYRTLYNMARVGIVHDDVLRMFQEVGCIEAIWPHTYFLPVYELARNGEVLLSSEVDPAATHGWPEYISIHQPAFEAELDRLVRAEPNVTLMQGETATALVQDADHVEVTTRRDDGTVSIVSGRWLIGSDGGNSLVREALGVPYEDLGFDQDWLVVDARELKKRPGMPAMRQFCEPEQPGVTLNMGPHHRRWSFMIFPDESREDAVSLDSVCRRLDRPEGETPEESELVRVAAYKFQSLFAERWRVGRVFLAGDSAHQMPPFLAQGLCSGFRDAHNLAWKLDLVLRGLAPPAFLDAYEAERGPNARATIVESMRVGQNVNERDPEKVRQRDAQLRALQAERQSNKGEARLIAFRVPGLAAGCIAGHAPAAGDAFPQARVALAGRSGRFDDIAGRSFLILHRGPAPALAEADAAFWRGLGGSVLELGGGGLVDAEGHYGKVLDAYGCDIILKRPDHYIFGACKDAAGLAALLADLRSQLTTGHTTNSRTGEAAE